MSDLTQKFYVTPIAERCYKWPCEFWATHAVKSSLTVRHVVGCKEHCEEFAQVQNAEGTEGIRLGPPNADT